MKLLLPCICFILLSFSSIAQGNANKGFIMPTKIKITGTIQDSTTAIAVSGATIELTNTAGINSDNYFKRSTVANLDGHFTVENIPPSETYILTITAIGYKTITKRISLTPQDNKNIGVIKMVTQTKTLANVVVTTTAAPSMQFGIDRKIFNVEKNITSQGGTAIDVMKNIPSLSVDVDGNVQMRNSTPQILIDGRPTILTLDQIPADDIERVELITNPSAKYDASSAGGIINIVMKKNKRTGLNGIASIGAGAPDLLNGNINLNLRQKNFNVFASGNYYTSKGNSKEETYRENKDNDTITDYFKQVSNNDRLRRFYSVRFGMDYFLDENNTLSFTQSFNNGHFGNDEIQNQQYSDYLKTLEYTGLRNSDGTGTFSRSSSRLSFERRFDKPDNKLTADITYNKGSRTDISSIINAFSYPDGSMYLPDNHVRNDGSGDDYQITGQIDYSNKINDDKRIEFGVRSYYNNSSTNFATYSIDGNNTETKLPLSNDYKYTEKINAGYFNYANKWNSLTYQFGLRVEISDFDGLLIDSNYHFGYKFPDGFKNLGYSLFPSFFLTKPLSDNEDLQFNYSKRIRRPRFWEVNPFVDINDPLNIREGNPALKPEYTNSFELNYFNRFNKNSGSFLAVLYFKNNVGDVTEYSDTIPPELYAQLNNAAISPGAILNTFINAGYTNRMGAEFTLQKKFGKNLDLTYNIDLQYRTTKASVNKINLDNHGFNFDTKLIANYKIVTDESKLFNNLSFQSISSYEGPSVIPQGKDKAQFVSDFAMRKEFLKNKAASLSLSVNDIFNTEKFGTIYDTENFYQDSYRRWSVRSFRVTFSYKFGDTDLDLFKRKNNNNNNTNDTEQGGIDRE